MSEQKEYSRAELKRIWMTGKYKGRRAMAEDLGYSYGQLKYYSKLDKWSSFQQKAAPLLEEKAISIFVDKEAPRLAKIHQGIVHLQEVLLSKVTKTIEKAKDMTVDDALKMGRLVAELQNKVLSPYQRELLNQRAPAPTGEGPGAAAVAAGSTQFNLNLSLNNGQVSIDTPNDKRLEDEDLERIIREGQGIILDEQPTAKPASKPRAKKAPEGEGGTGGQGAPAAPQG